MTTASHPFSAHSREEHLSLFHNSPSGNGRQQFIFHSPSQANPGAPASPCMPFVPVPNHQGSPPLGSVQFVPNFLTPGAKHWTQHYSRSSLIKSNRYPPQLHGHALANTAQHTVSLHRCKSTLLTSIQHYFLVTIYFHSSSSPTLRIQG